MQRNIEIGNNLQDNNMKHVNTYWVNKNMMMDNAVKNAERPQPHGLSAKMLLSVEETVSESLTLVLYGYFHFVNSRSGHGCFKTFRRTIKPWNDVLYKVTVQETVNIVGNALHKTFSFISDCCVLDDNFSAIICEVETHCNKNSFSKQLKHDIVIKSGLNNTFSCLAVRN